MRKKTAVAAMAVAVTLPVASVATPAQASVYCGGYKARDICYGPDSSQCVDLTVEVRASANHEQGTAFGQISADRDDGVARVQVDKVSLMTRSATLKWHGPVNSKNTDPPVAQAETRPGVRWTWKLRYHSVLAFSVRLANGTLRHGTYAGRWVYGGSCFVA